MMIDVWSHRSSSHGSPTNTRIEPLGPPLDQDANSNFSTLCKGIPKGKNACMTLERDVDTKTNPT